MSTKKKKKSQTSIRSDMFDRSLVKTNGGGTFNQSDDLLIDVLLSKTRESYKKKWSKKKTSHSKFDMLKAEFVPYSEKLRKSSERRRAAKTTESIEVGGRAPDFTLFNTENQPVCLHDVLKGSHVVLVFFPLAFTDVCTQELCTIRDKMFQYERLNAKVFGISVDSMFALKKFREEKNYQFDLLSDFNKSVCQQYNVFYDEFPLFQMKGVTKRAAFVIDRHGVVQHAEILADPSRIPDFHLIETALENCQSN